MNIRIEKRISLKCFSLALLLLFGTYSVNGQEQPPAGGNLTRAGGPASIQVTNEFLFLEVIEDFEEAEDWKAKSTSPLGETRTIKIVQRGPIRSAVDGGERVYDDEPYSLEQNPERPNHIMGIKTYFKDRGFDRVEVKPPHYYLINGKARQFSIWVLGRNFRHTLYLKLKDYRGRIHKLRLGRLNFYGWRKMNLIVPGWLPQSTRYTLLGRHLKFVSLFVTSDYHEPEGEFYFYLDGFKMLVDRRENSYPGSEIKDTW